MEVKSLKTHQRTSGDIKKVEASKKQMSLAKSFASTSEKVTVQQTFSVATPQVKTGEILMGFQAVLCHTSSGMMELFVQISKDYFPDKLQLGQTKIGYLVQFGLAPYYIERRYLACYSLKLAFLQSLFLVLMEHLTEYLNESKWMLM